MGKKSRHGKKANKLLSKNHAQLSCTQEITSDHGVSKVVFRNAIFIGVVGSLAFGVYFNALFNGFVWDDTYQVIGNYWIRDFRYLGAIFTHNVFAFNDSAPSNYYRPIMYVIYMINYHLFWTAAVGDITWLN